MKISEVVERTGISAYTLRYYEKLGLIKRIDRAGGRRRYEQEDIRWIEFIQRLKATGMSLVQIREYADLRYLGYSTVTERKEILLRHKEKLAVEIEELKACFKVLNKKIKVYEEMEKKYDTLCRGTEESQED